MFRPFGPIQSLELLNAILERNAAHFESADLQNKRDAIANSLMAVATFLSEHGVDLSNLKAILHPVEALTERENNRLDPLFCDRARGGAPRRSLKQNQFDGIIAALANHWLMHIADSSVPMSSRLSALARLLSRAGFESISAAQIKQARELVAQESSDHAARIMARQVENHLMRISKDHGENSAFETLLPIMAQFSLSM